MRFERRKNLLHLVTLTGLARPVDGPGPVRHWLLDNKDEPRLAVVLDGATADLYYRDTATGAWRKLASQRSFTGSAGAITPVAFGAPGILYVTSAKGRQTTALFAMNMETGKLDDELLVAAAAYDFDGELVSSAGKVVGFSVTTDAAAALWFNPAMKAVQEEIDRRQPGMVNLVAVDADPEIKRPRWVARKWCATRRATACRFRRC